MRQEVHGISREDEPAQEKLLVSVAFSFDYSFGDFNAMAVDDGGARVDAKRG